MITKKGKFITFIFSCFPGAAHMYMGFMKLGASIMSLFFIILMAGSWLNLSPVLYSLPIIWFYSFFDSNNKNSLPDESFSTLTDYFIFNINANDFKHFQSENSKRILAIVFVIFGCEILFENMIKILGHLIPESIYYNLISIIRLIPQCLVAGIIIYIGIRLIQGKTIGFSNNQKALKEAEENEYFSNHWNKE